MVRERVGTGRGSVSGHVATVFGSTGFLGRFVVQHLAGNGTVCYLPYRGDDMEIRHLRVMGDVGMVAPLPFSVRDKESLRTAMKHSDIVINVIGKTADTKHALPSWINYTLEDTHITAAATIAEVAKEVGVERLVHVSALSADVNSESRWARTKALGEQEVLKAFPDATIIRPADMFGMRDKFLTQLADLRRDPMFAYRIPLVRGGGALVQPVFANDVALGIAAIVEDNHLTGGVYDCAGPAVFSRREVADMVHHYTQREQLYVDMPRSLLARLGRARSFYLSNPLFTEDDVLLWDRDNVLVPQEGHLALEDLGVTPSSMERELYTILLRFRAHHKVGDR